ncbi:MAG TPA: NAD-dependent epimerase/dehydratase family protein [Terriglobales bacterium]|nr:NAD-dependent epimerase/dehydratase family protein [Terriglobales bacterium]
MKPVLVWGATGFIGQHLVRTLVGRQMPVIALTRRPLGLGSLPQHPLVRWISLPEEDASVEAYAEVIREVEIIFNLAGNSGAVASNLNPIASLEGNLYIQARFLQACELSNTKPHVIFASSRLVYGTPDRLPVTEDCPIKPASYYAAHKVALEHYHHIAALRSVITHTICRISNPYGAETEVRPGQFRAFIDVLIDRACQGQPMEIFGDGSQLRDYLFIDDLSEALLLCAVRPEARNEIFNVGYGKSLSLIEAAKIISDYTGAPIIHRPWHPEAALVESGDYVVDISKAHRLLEFQPRFEFDGSMQQLIKTRKPSAAAARFGTSG